MRTILRTVLVLASLVALAGCNSPPDPEGDPMPEADPASFDSTDDGATVDNRMAVADPRADRCVTAATART